MSLLRIVFVALLALLAGGVAPALAQDATPAAGDVLFADAMGLTELRVTATDTGYEGMPAEVEAGWYLMTLENRSAGEVGLEFLGVPAGMTAEALTAAVSAAGPPGPPASPDAGTAATPDGSTAAQDTEGSGAPPDFYYEVHMPGGPYAEFAGQTVQAVVELRPGDYVVWAGLPGVPQAPQGLTVTGAAAGTPAAEPAIDADFTITYTGSTGEVWGFDYAGTLAPGPQVVRIDNPTDQPHFVVFIQSPGPITVEEALAVLGTPPGGTPPAGLPDPGSLIDAGGSGTQSAGTTQWVAANLEPGTYVVACFIGDPAADHAPHAFLGMLDVIPVGDAGTPAA